MSKKVVLCSVSFALDAWYNPDSDVFDALYKLQKQGYQIIFVTSVQGTFNHLEKYISGFDYLLHHYYVNHEVEAYKTAEGTKVGCSNFNNLLEKYSGYDIMLLTNSPYLVEMVLLNGSASVYVQNKFDGYYDDREGVSDFTELLKELESTPIAFEHVIDMTSKLRELSFFGLLANLFKKKK